MYLRVIHQKVDKGLSLQEASKAINISHKQILDWKKQAGTMKKYLLTVCKMKCFSHFCILFLGKPNGRIVQCEFPMYPEGMI